MSDSYQAVPVSGEGDPAVAKHLPLVLALFTLGVEVLERAGFVETVEVIEGAPVRKHAWLLKARSRDGRHETAKLIEAWLDPERKWFKRNPEHPFTYLEANHRQREHALAELAKSVPLGVVRKGDRVVMIPMDATPDEEAALLAKLDAA
ncbi:MAG: hypothetical protein ABMA13_20605 [Chthoniobacteraceae bacterium]